MYTSAISRSEHSCTAYITLLNIFTIIALVFVTIIIVISIIYRPRRPALTKMKNITPLLWQQARSTVRGCSVLLTTKTK